jgi:hypothetical protein
MIVTRNALLNYSSLLIPPYRSFVELQTSVNTKLYPRLLYNGYLIFPGSKAAEVRRGPHTTSSDEVKERVELLSVD